MHLTPARPEQTGGGPGRQAPGASSPPSGSGSAGATCPAGANCFPSGRQEDRPCGEWSCSSLGPTGADLGPRELIPCGRTRLCNLELPPLCAFSKCRRLLSRAHSPGNLRGPPATRLGLGVKVRRAQVLHTAGGSGTDAAWQAPPRPAPTERAGLSAQVTEGHSWWDPGRTEDPEAGLCPTWQQVRVRVRVTGGSVNPRQGARAQAHSEEGASGQGSRLARPEHSGTHHEPPLGGGGPGAICWAHSGEGTASPAQSSRGFPAKANCLEA